MHEHALMQRLMQKIESVAADQGARRVKGVRVWLGALSHFTADHFREHFDDAARGTRAEHAALSIEVSTDLSDPRAQDVVLESVDVEIAE